MTRLSTLPLLLLLSLLTLTLAQSNTDGSLPDSAADGVDPILKPDPRPTIYGYLVNEPSGRFGVLAAAIAARNLTAQLDNPATRFTLFAPVDSAFADLARRLNPNVQFDSSDPSAVIEALLEGLKPLRSLEEADFVDIDRLLNYHVIGDDLTYEDLERESPLKTASGSTIEVIDGEIVDKDPEQNVTASIVNVFTLNGWVHVVPQVLLSFQLQSALDAIAAASASPTPTMTPSPVPMPSPAAPEAPAVDPELGPSPITELPGEEEIVEGPEEVEGTPGGGFGVSPEGSAEDGEDGEAVCFPGDASVTLASGEVVRMQAVAAGDEVRVIENGKTSRVVAFTHKTMEKKGIFYRLNTQSGHTVRMTGGHYVYANGRLTAARAVKVGDELRTVQGVSKVVSVGVEKGVGLFAPHTLHGDLIVDGVVVSGYSRAVMPWLAHALLTPVRLMARMGVREPLGGAFYEGADGLAWMMPSGRERY